MLDEHRGINDTLKKNLKEKSLAWHTKLLEIASDHISYFLIYTLVMG
jgi:hypothetical protein